MNNISKIALWLITGLILSPNCAFSQKVLKLEDAIAIAIKNSPDIIKSELNMTISEENLKAMEAATKSNFSFQLSPFGYSQTRSFNELTSSWFTSETKNAFGDFIVSQPIVKTDGRITLQNHLEYKDAYSGYNNQHSKGYNNNLYLTLSQPLFTYNRQKMQIEELKLSLENATLSYSIQRLNLEQYVTQQFYQLYKSVMSLNIAKEDFENQKASYEIIKTKVEGGLSPQAELYQAEVNLATSESNVQNLQLTLENSKDNFRQYIGMPINEDFAIEGDSGYVQVKVNLDQAVKNGLETRMELRQREISMINTKFSLIQAKSTNEFKANANLSLGLTGDNPEFQNIYEKPTRSPQVQLTFTIPIWDWGERKSRIKAAEASLQIEEINTQNQRNNIELAIRQSYRSLLNLQMQIDISRKSERNAKLTYEINLERYKNGDLTSKDLGQYQSQLSQAKINLANSLINYKLELLNMKIQSLWDFENDISFVPKNLQNNVNTSKTKK
jgi:outer membrane protein TolC